MSTLGVPTKATERAFPPCPRADRYFPAPVFEEARQRLEACVERGEGPALLIGAAGVGKTMLVEVLAESLADRFTVVQLAGSQLCTRRALLQALLSGLGLPYRQRDEGELRLALADHLKNPQECPAGVAVLVDEAHMLPTRLLEELRVLTNLARRGEPLVRMVLAGGPGLEEAFAEPALEAFNQRVAARCYLAPLTYAETRGYVRSQTAAAGADPDQVFDGPALDAVHSATDGVPRLINQVCDRSLALAVEHDRSRVDAQLVQLAWADLHQLPAPWHTPSPSTPEAAGPTQISAPRAAVSSGASQGIVEFGVLEDSVADSHAWQASPVPSAGLWNADQALQRVGAEAPLATRGAQAPAVPFVSRGESLVEEELDEAADPFGEDFAEEELVIDRFAAIEESFRPATPVVANRHDPGFSALVRGAETLDVRRERVAQSAQAWGGDGLSVAFGPAEQLDVLTIPVRDFAPVTTPSRPAPPDPQELNILLIEDDEPSPSQNHGATAPSDYRQLFVRLRQG